MGCDPIGGMGDLGGGRRPVVSGSGGGKRVRSLSTMLTRFSGRTSDSGGHDVLMKAGTVAQQSDVKVFSLTAMQDGRFAIADLRLRAGASGRAPCAIWLPALGFWLLGPTSRRVARRDRRIRTAGSGHPSRQGTRILRGGPSTWITANFHDNSSSPARPAGCGTVATTERVARYPGVAHPPKVAARRRARRSPHADKTADSGAMVPRTIADGTAGCHRSKLAFSSPGSGCGAWSCTPSVSL